MSQINQLYWIIAVPNDKNHEATILRLGNCVTEFAECSPFTVPELKVGTLDSLLAMSDELVKVDHMIDHTTRKIGNQIFSLRDTKPEKGQTWLTIGQAGIDDYVRKFEWNHAKYPTRLSCKELTERMQSQVSSIEEELRLKTTEFQQLVANIAQIERTKGGNLTVRDLTELVNIEDHIDSEYLTTLYVVVPNHQRIEWENKYEKLTQVVPRSNQSIKTEGDQTLFSIVVFKKYVQDVKQEVRDLKFTARELTIDPDNFISGSELYHNLKDELVRQKSLFLQWCKSNFVEAFQTWTHLKAIRVHVECILRYGLPVNFQAAVVRLHRPQNEKKLRSKLALEFSKINSVHLQEVKGQEDVPGILSGGEKFYPYVYLEMNLDYAKE